MIDYYGTDVRRINHALKVYGFAQTIALQENLHAEQFAIVELAAILHDIGIPVSEQKYGSCDGKYQEIEGPPIARQMLENYKIPAHIIDRVCFIIGHHHTLKAIEGIDFQIIVEADFFVNAFEEEISKSAIIHMRNSWFKTKSGINLLNRLYL
jgi:hypothetical protein